MPLPYCLLGCLCQHAIAAHGTYVLDVSARIDLQLEHHLSFNVPQFCQLRILRSDNLRWVQRGSRRNAWGLVRCYRLA